MNSRYKQYIPNCITIFRMFLAICMIFIDIFSMEFYIAYILCGVTDVLDGFLARKFMVSSNLGSLLDTIADFLMTVILFIILIPVVKVPRFIVMFVIIILIIRLISIVFSLAKYKRFVILHTICNKATGLSLYILVLFLNTAISIKLMTFVCLIAVISSIEELFIYKKSNKLDRNIKSIIKIDNK